MQISVNFTLPAETKVEAQIKLQTLKQALAAANIIPQQIRINVIERQSVDYAKIGMS